MKPMGSDEINLSRKKLDINEHYSEAQHKNSFKILKSHSKMPHINMALPIKAVIIAVATLVLLSIGLVNYSTIYAPAQIFLSLIFFLNFIFIFIVIAVYDYLVAKRVLTYQALFSSIILSLLLSTSVVISPTGSVIANLVIMFLGLWAGFAIGRRLYDTAYAKGYLRVLNGSATFLIILWVAYLIVNFGGVKVTSISNTTNGIILFLDNVLVNIKSGTFFAGGLQSSALSSCVSQTNQYANIGVLKTPQADGSRESINIDNTTIFTSYSQINPWIVQWASIPSTGLFSFGQTQGVNCNGSSSVYICKDLALLNQTTAPAGTNITANTLAVGVILEISLTQPLIFTNGNETTNYLLPVLCTNTGTILPNSKYYISH